MNGHLGKIIGGALVVAMFALMGWTLSAVAQLQTMAAANAESIATIKAALPQFVTQRELDMRAVDLRRRLNAIEQRQRGQ